MINGVAAEYMMAILSCVFIVMCTSTVNWTFLLALRSGMRQQRLGTVSSSCVLIYWWLSPWQPWDTCPLKWRLVCMLSLILSFSLSFSLSEDLSPRTMPQGYLTWWLLAVPSPPGRADAPVSTVLPVIIIIWPCWSFMNIWTSWPCSVIISTRHSQKRTGHPT